MSATTSSPRLVGGEKLPRFFALMAADGVRAERLAFVCIGTDRSTGDSLGPLVGTMLQEAGYGCVIGTLAQPCDADTLPARLRELEAGRIVLAIDACLGQPASVGCYRVSAAGVAPGASMRRQLPVVGDYAVAAVVGELTDAPYKVLQRTSLHRVMEMAKRIVAAIRETWPPA